MVRDKISDEVDSSEELDTAPCPECGEEGTVYSDYGDEGDISCSECGVNRGPI